VSRLKAFVSSFDRPKLLIFILAALVVADGIITRFLVTRDLGTEINPFLQTWVYDDRFVWLKLIGALAVTLILWDIYRRAISRNRLKPLLVILYILVGFCTVIVLWNLLVLFTAIV